MHTQSIWRRKSDARGRKCCRHRKLYFETSAAARVAGIPSRIEIMIYIRRRSNAMWHFI